MPDNDIGAVVLINPSTGAAYAVSAGGVSQADNSAFTVNTDSAAPAMGIYESAPTTVTDNRVAVVGITSKRVLKVALHDAAGAAITTLPVSLASTTVTGTVAVTQSGTWDEVGINDSGNSITVDAPVATPVFVRLSDGASAIATLPVSLASVPTHAVTVASGGIASGAVASGAVASGAIASGAIASGAIAAGAVAAGAYVSGSILSGALASGAVVDITNVSTPVTPATATATKGLLQGVEYRSTLPTFTNTQQGVLQSGTRGSLHVELWNSDAAVAVPNGSGNATGALRVELANNGTGLISTVSTVTTVTTLTGTTTLTPGTGAANLGKAEDAAHTTGDVGVMALGVRSAAPSERSAGPTDGDYEPFATNEVGAVWATLTPSVNGGVTTFMASGSDGSSILVATKQTIKASAGNLYGYYVYNPEAAVTFLHIYNTDTVTVGTTNPQLSFAIPAGAAANLSFPHGVAFSTALSCAATTTAGGNTAPATGLSFVAWYK